MILVKKRNINSDIFLKNTFNLIKNIIIFISVICICALILIFPKFSSEGVKKGLFFCSDIIIPSLFPFMVISSFIVKSNLSLKIGKLMSPLTKFLFNLPGYIGPTIILGLIGGYPTSARGVKSLFEKKIITDSDAERIMLFSVGAGPAFVVSIIGINFLRNSKAGIIILVSQITASIILGVLIGLFYKTNKINFTNNKKNTQNSEKVKLSSAFIESCSDSCYGLINLCSLVVVFSVIILFLDSLGVSNIISTILSNLGISHRISKSILPIFLEVTSGSMIASQNGAPIELMSFALGWGGICVHFQIFSALHGINFSIIKFMIFRFFHGLIAALITNILLHFFPISIEVFSNTNRSLEIATYSDYTGCVALILLSIFFVLSISQKRMC